MRLNKYVLACMFCWVLGLAGLTIAIHSGITGKGPTGQVLIITESENFFIRYSLQLMFVSLSLGMIVTPILFLKGYLGPHGSILNKYDKAKGEFILSNFLFLGMFFAFLAGGHNGKISTKGKVIAALFALYYLYTVVKFIKAYIHRHSQAT